MADNKDENYDGAIGWMIMLVVIAALLWLFWFFFDTEIRNLIRWIRYGEMWLMSWILPADYTVAWNGGRLNWHEGFRMVPSWSAPELNNEHLGLFSALAMQPLRHFFAALMAGGAIWCIMNGPKTQFRKTLGLEGLIAYQAQNFPAIAPFIKFNPSKQPPRPPGSPVPSELPLFAEALGPEEWLAYNQIQPIDSQIPEKATTKAFQKQLIARWKGAKALPPYMQILLACFCLKASRKRGQADEMLGRLASCWSPEKGLKLSLDKKLHSEAKKILSNKDLAAKTLAQANKHAFVTTAMLRALQFAREEGGVLAPAQFVWLRAHNRTLWYPMNNLGRQSFHMEALGAMSHFKAERMTQRPIPVPKVSGAVETITGYMQSIDARPIPDLDYKGSDKRGIKKAI